MLSYQHAYHAGGPADVHKHVALARLLAAMTADPAPLRYMETHAGRGLYDLAGPETAKTREAAEGIFAADLSAEVLEGVLAEVRAGFGPDAYPGSPVIAAHMLRDRDEMRLMELHPAEHSALAELLPGGGVEQRDGYEGVLAHAGGRGLVLVDPSYEVKTEYAEAGAFVRELVARWPEVVVLVWYPVLRAGRHAKLLAELEPLGTVIDEVSFRLKGGAGMLGSGLAAVNLPEGVRLSGPSDLRIWTKKKGGATA